MKKLIVRKKTVFQIENMAVNNASNYWKDFQDFLKEKYRKRELEDQRELDKLLCSMYALLQLVKINQDQSILILKKFRNYLKLFNHN